MVILGNRIINRKINNLFDVDALAYTTAVETADGQVLEPSVKDAINTFVIGLKQDGIWDAIKACCILAGARTLSGALIPLRGSAPTNFNFVNADYSRKTGLKGNRSTKSIDTNRLNAADPQNNNHNAVFVTESNTIANNQPATMISTIGQTVGGRNRLGVLITGWGEVRLQVSSRSFGGITATTSFTDINFIGFSRNNSSQIITRINGNNITSNSTSDGLSAGTVKIFSDPTQSLSSNARMSFYSIGESLNLELLDNRVTTLMNTLNSIL